MKPSKLFSWTVAVTACVIVVVGAVFFLIDWYRADFSRLGTFLNILLHTKGGLPPIVQAALAVIYASIPATIVVIFFRGRNGNLELSALGIKLKGPAGPILLWVVCFLAAAVLILSVARL